MHVKHKLRFYLAIIYLVDFPVIPGATKLAVEHSLVACGLKRINARVTSL